MAFVTMLKVVVTNEIYDRWRIQTTGTSDGFWSPATGGQLRPDVLGRGARDPAGRRSGVGQAGRRTAHRRRRLPVGDLGPDRRIVDGPVVDVRGGCGHALLNLDEKHRCPL